MDLLVEIYFEDPKLSAWLYFSISHLSGFPSKFACVLICVRHLILLLFISHLCIQPLYLNLYFLLNNTN